MEPLLTGYRAHYTDRIPEWLRASGAEEVCWVVNHMIRVPDLPLPEFWPTQMFAAAGSPGPARISPSGSTGAVTTGNLRIRCPSSAKIG
jgi:hypothetical protein